MGEIESECVHEVSVGWSQTVMSPMKGRRADITHGRGGWLWTEDVGGLLRRDHLNCLEEEEAADSRHLEKVISGVGT